MIAVVRSVESFSASVHHRDEKSQPDSAALAISQYSREAAAEPRDAASPTSSLSSQKPTKDERKNGIILRHSPTIYQNTHLKDSGLGSSEAAMYLLKCKIAPLRAFKFTTFWPVVQ
jgi:hypothetical protein